MNFPMEGLSGRGMENGTKDVPRVGSDITIKSVGQKVVEHLSRIDTPSEGLSHKKDISEKNKRLSVQKMKQSLMSVGSHEQQLQKIDILLQLVYGYRNEKEEREKYFNQALNIARRYLGKEYIEDSSFLYKEAIMTTYGKYIDPKFNKLLSILHRSKDSDLIQMSLSDKYRALISDDEKQNKELESLKNPEVFFKGITDPDKMLERLKEFFGPFHLLITPKEGRGVMVAYGIVSQNSEGDTTNSAYENESALYLYKKGTNKIRDITVDIFGKKADYSVIMNYGSHELANQISDTHWEGFMEGVIDYFIRSLKLKFVEDHHGNLKHIWKMEQEMMISLPNRDYTEFINHALDQADLQVSFESRMDKESYIKNLLKAIDICRFFTLKHSGNKNIKNLDPFSYIDTILGGKINRSILDMVKYILLSRDETMDGLGYPFGHSKQDISLEGRIYSIIRAFEAFSSDKNVSLESIKVIMYRVTGSGYFDSNLLDIFFNALKANKIKINVGINPYQKQDTLSPRRREVYGAYIFSYEKMMSIIATIEAKYFEFRTSHADTGTQSERIMSVENLKESLVREADLIHVFGPRRHGPTPNDEAQKIDGIGKSDPPDAALSQKGVVVATEMGSKIKGVEATIYTGPSRRTSQTAENMVENAGSNFVSCPEIISNIFEPNRKMVSEKSLRNPDKHLDNERYDIAGKLIGDFEVLRELLSFLRGIVYSSKESVNFLISHGTTFFYILFILKHFGINGKIIAMTFNKEEIPEKCIIRGGRWVEQNLFFPMDWAPTMHELHRIIIDVFGKDSFRIMGQQKIKPIKAHKDFLDYMDYMCEKYPEKIPNLIKRLYVNPLTKHFPEILGAEGCIK